MPSPWVARVFTRVRLASSRLQKTTAFDVTFEKSGEKRVLDRFVEKV